MQLNFDAGTVEPGGSFEPVPANDYTVVITASEEKPTKAKTGSFLELKMEIIEGEYKGRILFERLNLNNPNETAVKIAQGDLSAICHATGVMTPGDSSDLHDKPMVATVVVKPAEGGYDPSNEIKKYSATSSAAPQSNSGGGGQPWKK